MQTTSRTLETGSPPEQQPIVFNLAQQGAPLGLIFSRLDGAQLFTYYTLSRVPRQWLQKACYRNHGDDYLHAVNSLANDSPVRDKVSQAA